MTNEDIRDLALEAELDMRLMIRDARESLDEFEEYLNSWNKELATVEDPRVFTQRYVIERALERIENLVHMHTGGTRHMHVRTGRQRLLELLAAR